MSISASSIGITAKDHRSATAFLGKVQDDQSLRQAVQAAATADDVAQIGAGLGFEFSGDELLRLSGKKVGRVTVIKQDLPGEYN